MTEISIDWKRPMEAVSPFVRGRGGIVLISAGEYAAGHTFLSFVRRTMHVAGALTIQFNPIDPDTRTPSDILRLLSYKLGLAAHPIGQLAILNDLTAGDNINISNVSITVNHNSAGGSPEVAEAVAAKIGSVVASRQIGLFFVDSAAYPPSTALWWTEDIWNMYLSPFVSDGLVAFVLTAPQRNGALFCDHPAVTAVIDLPDIYCGDDLRCAIDDVAALLLGGGATQPEVAQSNAEMFLAAMEYRPQLVHSKVIATMARLAGQKPS